MIRIIWAWRRGSIWFRCVCSTTAASGISVGSTVRLRWVYDHRDSFRNPITTVNLSLGASWNSSHLAGLGEFGD